MMLTTTAAALTVMLAADMRVNPIPPHDSGAGVPGRDHVLDEHTTAPVAKVLHPASWPSRHLYPEGEAQRSGGLMTFTVQRGSDAYFE